MFDYFNYHNKIFQKNILVIILRNNYYYNYYNLFFSYKIFNRWA